MAPRRTAPLIHEVELQPRNGSTQYISDDDPEKPTKRWYHRLPLGVTVGLILAPQPSILWVLVDHHLRTLQQPFIFLIHLMAIYTLTFFIFSSLIICVSRDPGPANAIPTRREEYGSNNQSEESVGIMDALMDTDDILAPGRWCRKCWAPKPERTHHCSICGRCVLKMDHHCPWLGSSCVGHRTYPAFVHFLTCITLLAIYIAVVSVQALIYSFHHPYDVGESTPIHELALAMVGIVFAIVIGPFAAYHHYLISINQTTLENISPFMLLRHLPPLPRTGHSLSDPPLEPELSYEQRKLVKQAHGHLSLYDVGWRKNWAQVFGWTSSYGLLHRLWCGGASSGDGRYFSRNPRSDEVLAKLATELVKVDRNL